MTRHETREYAFILLFEAMLRNEEAQSTEFLYALTEEMIGLHVTDEVAAFVTGVLNHREELDEIIAKYSEKRSLSRVAAVNRTILRLALYELRYTPKTPINVVISEAVALSQAYAYAEDTAFINGVLGTYARNAVSKQNLLNTEEEKNDHGADSGA